MAKKILVVDDEPDILKVVTFRLRKAGYEVMTANDGKQALDILRSSPDFDLIVLDLLMPVMDGYELNGIIKEDENLKDIPVIFLTASVRASELAEQWISLKADRFILKPFEPEEFLELVKKIVGE